jgi:hypothetical protein
MARRGHNDGSIYKRNDGRWCAAISLANGKRKYLYGKTREEVRRQMLVVQRDLDCGLPLPDGRQTVEQYLRSWLTTSRPRLDAGTAKRDREFVG